MDNPVEEAKRSTRSAHPDRKASLTTELNLLNSSAIGVKELHMLSSDDRISRSPQSIAGVGLFALPSAPPVVEDPKGAEDNQFADSSTSDLSNPS